MKQILIASHGHFASGVKSTIDLIFGEREDITAIDCYTDDEQPKDKIETYLGTLKPEDALIICTDIAGGSVNQLMVQYLSRPNTYLIAGVNVAFMVELSMAPDMPSREELKAMIERGRNQLMYAGLFLQCAIYGLVGFSTVYFGASAVEGFINSIPASIMNGLNVAGGLLPAVGFALLVQPMMNKNNII